MPAPTPDAAAFLEKARILSEALPFMQRYAGKIVVVKYGGAAMGDAARTAGFARDVVLLRQSAVLPVVVHGGGPQIDALLARMGVTSDFRDGLRITGAQEVEAAEMVLAGSVNKQLVRAIQAAGGRAAGLSGSDDGLIRARPHGGRAGELGLVGVPERIDPALISILLEAGRIPVIAPLGVFAGGQPCNINADTAAGALAVALAATRLVLLTDVDAVRGADGKPRPALDLDQARALLASGAAQGGMRPKIETCIEAVAGGVPAAVILNGGVPHALLLELFTGSGAGTLIGQPLAPGAQA